MYCVSIGRLFGLAIFGLFSVSLTFAADAALPAPEKQALWPDDKAPIDAKDVEKANAFITIHRPAAADANGASVVICPGGGYGGLVTGAEGHGIADWLVSHGITGVVLEYRLPRGRSHVPLLDAQRAIRTIRARATDLKLDPHRIGIMGFSAGGHLASTAGTHFDDGKSEASDPIERASSRPDFVLLVYPVITMTDKGHSGSRKNLLGREPTPEQLDLFSNEKQVTDKTPPTFMAHAKDDKLVPLENSRMFYDALLAHHVPAEYLELPQGGARPQRVQRAPCGKPGRPSRWNFWPRRK